MPSSPEVKQTSTVRDAAPSGPDVTDPDAWPDAPPMHKRAIKAGPDLEIVAEGTSGAAAETGPGVNFDAGSARDSDVDSGQGPVAELSQEILGGDDDPADATGVNVGAGAASERLTAVVGVLLGRVDEGDLEQHLVEYNEPLIWMWRRLVGAAFAFIVASATWYLIKVPSGLISDARLPTQGQVAAAFHDLRINGFAGANLSGHVGMSLFRLAVGLGVGSVLGVSVGLVAGAAPLVRTIVDPISSFFRTVPGLAAGPLLLLWFGTGEAGLLSVVVFSVMWTATAAAADGRTESLRSGSADVIGLVFSGARSALLVAWATVLAIETVMAQTGLGSMIWFAQGRSDLLIAGIAVAGLTGFFLDTLLRCAHYLVLRSDLRTAVSQQR